MGRYQLIPGLMIVFFVIAGCSSDVGLRKTGPAGRSHYEDSFIYNGGFSAETVNLLGNHLLNSKMNVAPEQFIRELEELCRTEPSGTTFIAMAETSQMLASGLRKKPDMAVRYDLTTLIYTQKYFQSSITGQSNLLFNPESIIAVKCYNQALTELFAYFKSRALHTAGTFELTAAGGQVIRFELPKFSLPVALGDIVEFHLCSDYRPVNLTHNSRTFGIGVPLMCELKKDSIPETVFSDGQVIPATLAIRLFPAEQGDTDSHYRAKLFYIDSRSLNEVTVNNIRVPLAQDFSTPLAFMVREPQVFNFLQRTFQIELTQSAAGLYHLEPHNDQRIPIVLVHGLMSDIRTWMQLINTLQSDPELRRNYRFMGFSYSSGNPILVSAMQLRQALAGERAKLAADGRDLTRFDRMVLIGHSMGGLISRFVISSSDDELLSDFVGKENYYTAGMYKDKAFRDMMIFQPVPSVKRVVFIAVPHRGSDLAQSWYGQLASKMIKIPQSLIEFNTKLIRSMINIPDDKKDYLMTHFNGIDNLSPSGAALRLLNMLPISENVPYHSVIGNEKQRGIPGGSDGVVSYSSSHLDGAESEIVVKSDHSVQQNPLAIQEIKRILKEHLKHQEKKND
ncbi:MAG: hypothetical protein E7043_03115 [Lentisphaerae bacterium]|nr:hypothetical protein [Lentisphaerota bacterium]MBE6389144.1 hypothetical protein [Lentisphaerota bacterium]